jgi:ABC-type polysaccharide/polyol phosphate export permease
MWWSSYWPTAWVFIGPLMMVLCMTMMFFMMRGMHRHRATPEWTGVGPSYWLSKSGKTQMGDNIAFNEYRTETLRRLEQEHVEFQRFLDQLRVAKDKAEFDQFMDTRRNRSQANS